MRKRFQIIQILFIVLLVMLPAVSRAADKVRLTLMEYAPLMGEKVKGYGIEPAIVTAAFKQVNIDVKYDFFPPARTFKAAEEGIYDGTVGWVWSEEREKSFYYSESIFTAPLVLFHLKGFAFEWETIHDLKEITIGITAKNYYGQAFHEALDAGKLTVDEASKDAVQFDKLLRRRIKLYPMNVYTGYYMIREQYDSQTAALFTHHLRPLKTTVYHVLFSRAVKENKARLDLFNQGLRQLKSSGEYDKIIAEYKTMYNLQ